MFTEIFNAYTDQDSSNNKKAKPISLSDLTFSQVQSQPDVAVVRPVFATAGAALYIFPTH
jgi:hypothetical protein